MPDIPLYISLTFALTTFLTVFLFWKASGFSKTTLIALVAWLAFQSAVALTGFYLDTYGLPPRFALLVLPPLILITSLFAAKNGKRYLDRLDAKTLTLLHIVRVPVEIVLFWLFLQKGIPELMTFEGLNFDIMSGITAPIIFYFGYVRKKLSLQLLLGWNFICIGLLVNIVVCAMLSAPSVFQQFAFEQPNIAVFHFPFVWLPCCVVPLVLLSHLAVVRQLLKQRAA